MTNHSEETLHGTNAIHSIEQTITLLDEVWIPYYSSRRDDWGITAARQMRNRLMAQLHGVKWYSMPPEAKLSGWFT